MSLMFFNAGSLQKPIPHIEYEQETKTRQLCHIVAHGFLVLYRQGKLGNELTHYHPLLMRHAEYFPKQLPVHIQKKSAKDQFEYLLMYNQPTKDILEPALAYTLQQLCVDVMCEKPAEYGTLFVEGFEPKALRTMEGLDAPAVIQVLAAEILKINIFVERHNERYFLPVREYYLTEEKNAEDLYLHFQNKHYTTPSDINELEKEVA
jgi:hypothetical protein